MNKYQFFIELLKRLSSSKPEFFAKLQTGAAILFTICGVVESLPMFGIELPEKALLINAGVMAFLFGVGLTSQAPNKDVTQK